MTIVKAPNKSKKYKLDSMPPAWQETIVRMRMRGKSLQHIQLFMKREYKMPISLGALSPWLKKKMELPPNALFMKDRYVKELEGVYINTLKKYDKLFNTAWEIVDDMKRESKTGTMRDKALVLSGVAELRQLTELSAKLLHDLPRSSDQVMDALKKAQVMANHLNDTGLLKELDAKKKVRMEEAESHAQKITLPTPNTVTVYGTPKSSPPVED